MRSTEECQLIKCPLLISWTCGLYYKGHRNSTSTPMLFTSGRSTNTNLAHSVYDFFTSHYEIESDVEVYHTNLSEDNAFGFTEVNGEEQFIQIHNKLSKSDYIKTLLHELVHVVQNENGQFDCEKREEEAYSLESTLFKQYHEEHSCTNM